MDGGSTADHAGAASTSGAGGWDCTHATAKSTTRPPAIWIECRPSSKIAHAASEARTGSSVATTATRGAGRWRSAVTLAERAEHGDAEAERDVLEAGERVV